MRGNDDESAQGAKRGSTGASERGLEEDSRPETQKDVKQKRASSSGGSSIRRQPGRGGQWQPLPTIRGKSEHWEPPSFRNPHHRGKRTLTPKGLPLQGSPLGVKQVTTYLGPGGDRKKNTLIRRQNDTPPPSTKAKKKTAGKRESRGSFSKQQTLKKSTKQSKDTPSFGSNTKYRTRKNGSPRSPVGSRGHQHTAHCTRHGAALWGAAQTVETVQRNWPTKG
jgi:hypothetical protein